MVFGIWTVAVSPILIPIYLFDREAFITDEEYEQWENDFHEPRPGLPTFIAEINSMYRYIYAFQDEFL